MLRFQLRELELHTRSPFGIARWSHQRYGRVVVTIEDGGIEGLGEAAPNAFYGETEATVQAVLPALAARLPDDPFALDEMWEAIEDTFPHHHRSAKAALETAVLDVAARRAGVSVRRLLGAPPPRAITSYTLGLGTPEEVAGRCREALERGHGTLKVKLGGENDAGLLAAVRDVAPDAHLRVDANAAWSAKEAVGHLPMLEAFGVELLEQPVAADDLEGLATVTRAARMPVVADESFHAARDLRHLRVDGVNVKLAKLGGPRQAALAMRCARALGFGVMLGCMVESSLGITAAAHVAGLADWIDLDGALLLDQDPFNGVTWDPLWRPVLPDAPGLGVTPS